MTTPVNTISSCEVCGETRLTPVLDLGRHPMCDDLVPVGDARACREYPIEILFCDTCGTAHQRYQVPKHDLFPATYHYRSRFTADVLKGMASLVDSCERHFGSLEGKTVLDVGCNDGSLLGFFRDRGAATLGIEPTGAFADAAEQGHTVYNGFLTESLAHDIRTTHGAPDFIVFTNVFAHIEDLRGVIRSLQAMMGPQTAIVIENHYLGAVLDGNQFDTFYHEHPRTYSYSSFVHIGRSLGLPLTHVEFPARYGGNIRVFLGGTRAEGDGGVADRSALDQREGRFLAQFAAMRENVSRWQASTRARIAALVATHGPLRAKAFPGRAAILVKLLGLDTSMVAAVYEKPGSMKIGHYLPGTRIPIRSDDDLFADPDQEAPILNLAWHIPQEIRGYLEQHGYRGSVIDIVSREDFDVPAHASGA